MPRLRCRGCCGTRVSLRGSRNSEMTLVSWALRPQFAQPNQPPLADFTPQRRNDNTAQVEDAHRTRPPARPGSCRSLSLSSPSFFCREGEFIRR